MSSRARCTSSVSPVCTRTSRVRACALHRDDVSRREPALDAFGSALGGHRVLVPAAREFQQGPCRVEHHFCRRFGEAPQDGFGAVQPPLCLGELPALQGHDSRARRRRSPGRTRSPPNRALAPARSPPWPAAPRSPDRATRLRIARCESAWSSSDRPADLAGPRPAPARGGARPPAADPPSPRRPRG